MEEILDPLHLRCLMAPSVGVQIWAHHRKNPRSRCVTLTSKPKTDPTETYLEACYLSFPWNSKIPGTQYNHRPLLQRLQKPSESIQGGSNAERC